MYNGIFKSLDWKEHIFICSMPEENKNVIGYIRDMLELFFRHTGLKPKEIILIVSCNGMNRILLSEEFRYAMKMNVNVDLSPEESIKTYFGFKEVVKI